MSLAQAAASKVIMDAAKRSLTDNLPVQEVADNVGVSREVLMNARMLFDFATPEELELIMQGKMAITTTADLVRKRLTPEQRSFLKKRNRFRSGGLKSDAELWAIFKPLINALASMPDAKDMLRVVKSNKVRENYLTENLETASNWLKEFMDEWNNSQRGKSAKDTTDTRSGGPTT